jgi:two-component system sensor histidine kinase KdpD
MGLRKRYLAVWLGVLIMLLLAAGWGIQNTYDLLLSLQWQKEAASLRQRLDRTLVDRELQLGVLAESLGARLKDPGSDALPADCSNLISRLDISEVVWHSPTQMRVLYPAAAQAQPKVWRATLYDFFRTSTMQVGIEITEFGPRLLDIEPLLQEGQTGGLEVCASLERFMRTFASREGVEMALVTQKGQSRKILCASAPLPGAISESPVYKRYSGGRSRGLFDKGGVLWGIIIADDVEYSSALAPSAGSPTRMVLWTNYTDAAAQLATQRNLVMGLSAVPITLLWLGVFYYFFYHRHKLRLLEEAARRQLLVSNISLKTEVESRQMAEESLRGISSELYADHERNLALLEKISHRIKLDASATLGFLDLALAGGVSLRENLDALKIMANQHLFMADNIAAWLRRRKGPLAKADCVLRRIAETTSQNLGKWYGEKKVSISINIADTILVNADSSLLEILLRNILVNALKYSPPGSSVEITARALRSGVELYVADGGSGIPGEIMKKLFDPTDRPLSPGVDGEQGLGLGLPIVKWICEAHSAQIRVISAGEQGCRVVFFFPSPEKKD